MPCRSALALPLIIASLLTTPSEADYLTPPFETLDEPALEERLRSSHPLQRAEAHFFLAERRELELKPGAAARHKESALAECRDLSHPFCDLVRAKSQASASPLVRFFSELPPSAAATDPNDRLYLEARTSLTKTPGMGFDSKRALISLASLKRLTSGRSSLDYWIARTQMIQENPKYHESLREAYDRNDTRTRLIYSPDKKLSRYFFDGLGPQWGAGVAASPRIGLGIAAKYANNRVADSDRDFRASITAGTRPAFLGNADYEDRAILKDYGFGVYLGGLVIRENDFGLGPDSLLSSRREVDRRFFAGGVYIKHYFFEPFHLSVGWRETRHVEPDNVPVRGLTGELGFDSRNSQFTPWEGSLVLLRGFFPMGDIKYESLEGLAEHNVALFKGSSVRVRGFLSSVSGNVPYFDLKENSLRNFMPGQREGRFRDRSAWGFSPEWRYRLGSFVTLGGFGSVGSVGQIPKWGGGLASEFSMSNEYRDRTRLEVSVYDGEVLVQIGLNLTP